MAKSAEEKAREWLNEQKRTPRPGSRAVLEPEKPSVPAGVELSGVLHLSPDELRPHPLNERFFRTETEDYFAKLTADITERGILVPLICRMDGVILSGHNRWKTARELGLAQVPVQKVIDELSPEKEKEFLIKDNLLRRQLSSDEKKRLIVELYGAEIEKLKKGGDRKSDDARIKVQVNSDRESGGLAERIQTETGIKAGTAKRIIAGIRKEKRPKLWKHQGLTEKDKKRLEKLRIHMRTLDQTLASLRERTRKAEQERARVAKEIQKLGEPELI